ncbi:Huntingtin-interacting protein 1, partial [Lamellibrachia satsuma]
YPEIPGNLLLQDEQLEKICAHDVNSYFELSVDMLDCMDDILSLQAAVFGSLDMSRSNSMTASGQCRLSPLILCVQDSCQVYDYIVKLLFKLHSSLPPDTLGGHRDRFYQQYESLKKFYSNSANLQYFKHLISVPVLPSEPPNFLRAADLTSHVKPVAVVPEPTVAPENDSTIDLLVDTSSTTSSQDDQARFEETFAQNGAHSPPEPTEKERTQDRFIEHLMKEVERLKAELVSQKAEGAMMMESLQTRIQQLEMELSEMKQIAESTSQENESLRDLVKETERNSDASDQLASAAPTAETSMTISVDVGNYLARGFN